MIRGEISGAILVSQGSGWKASAGSEKEVVEILGDEDTIPFVGERGRGRSRRRSFVTMRNIMAARMKGPPPHRYHSGLTWRSVIPKILYTSDQFSSLQGE
jgi:hypothetical protein